MAGDAHSEQITEALVEDVPAPRPRTHRRAEICHESAQAVRVDRPKSAVDAFPRFHRFAAN
jgi:hypothetical protein